MSSVPKTYGTKTRDKDEERTRRRATFKSGEHVAAAGMMVLLVVCEADETF